MHCLSCGSCHATWCYAKLLEVGLHSACALTAHDIGHKYLHERHGAFSKKEHKMGQSAVHKAEKTGIGLTAYHDMLAVVAQKYSACKPQNREYVKPGWYDHTCHTAGETTLPDEVRH